MQVKFFHLAKKEVELHLVAHWQHAGSEHFSYIFYDSPTFAFVHTHGLRKF